MQELDVKLMGRGSSDMDIGIENQRLGVFAVWLFCALLPFSLSSSIGKDLFWPTPNPAFLQGMDPDFYLQPTESGRIESASYGCSRNQGSRFHEGIDLKAIWRDNRGVARDPVGSIAAGTVAHISNNTADSNYGKYIVIVHHSDGVEWYSLYSHLRSIRPELAVGLQVRGGESLGIMGASSSSISIPESRAHLHLEIGVRLNRRFDHWYSNQAFDTPNPHASWNGINLLGVDPLAFFRFFLDNPDEGFDSFFLKEPVAFELLLHFRRPPDYLLRSFAFLETTRIPNEPHWYRVGFTWYGMPVSWTPVPATQVDRRFDPNSVHVRSLTQSRTCRMWIRETRQGFVPTPMLLRQLAILMTDSQ